MRTPLNAGVSGGRRARAPSTEARAESASSTAGEGAGLEAGRGRRHRPLAPVPGSGGRVATGCWRRESGTDKSFGSAAESKGVVAAGRGRGTNRSRRSSREGTVCQ